MAEGLTTKQRLFVEAYLSCLNATEAARRAGYSERTAYSIGWENLKKPEIAAAIQSGLAERAMPADEALARLADMARATADDFISIYESPLQDVTGQPILDKEGQPITRYFPSLDLEKARERGMLHLVKKITYTAHGPSVELYDGQAALVKLGEYHRMFGGKNINLNLTPDDLKAMSDDDLDKLAEQLDKAAR